MVKLTDFEKRLSQAVKESTVNDADRQNANPQVLDIVSVWKNDAPNIFANWNRPFTTPDELNLQIAARQDRNMPLHRHAAKLNGVAENIVLKEKQLVEVNQLIASDPELKEKGVAASYKRWRAEVKQEQLEKEIRSAKEQLVKQHQKLIVDRQLFVVNLLRMKPLDPELRTQIFIQYAERQLNDKLNVMRRSPEMFRDDIQLAEKMLADLNSVKMSGKNILEHHQIRKFSQMLVAFTKKEDTKPGKKSSMVFLHKRLAACANALNDALGRESLLNIKAIKVQKDRLKKETAAPDTERSCVELQSAIAKATKMASYYEKQRQYFVTAKDESINIPLQQKWDQVRIGLEAILLGNVNTQAGATAIDTKQALIDLENFAFKKDNTLSKTDPKLSVDDMKRIRGAIRPLQAALEKDIKNNQSYSIMPAGMQTPTEVSHLKQIRSIDKMRGRYLAALPDGDTRKKVDGMITDYLNRLTTYATALTIYEKGMLPEQQKMRSKPAVDGTGSVTPEAQATHDQMLSDSSKVAGAALEKLKAEKVALEQMKTEIQKLATVYPSVAWVVAYQKLPAGTPQRKAMEMEIEGNIKHVLTPGAAPLKKTTDHVAQQRRAASAMFSGYGEEPVDFVGPHPQSTPSNRNTP